MVKTIDRKLGFVFILSTFNQTAMLYDNHGRPITYLRLSVTDRCNLRCVYCMPAHGIDVIPKDEILSFEEMERLLRLLCDMGIAKARITGGEPFVRKDLIKFLWRIHDLPKELHLTTNGLWSAQYVPELKAMGIKGVNLSLDTLDRERFHRITRRDELHLAMDTFHALLRYDIPIKLNAVVMNGLNDIDIVPLAELTKDYPIDVRYIEEMPFNGEGANAPLIWNYQKILSVLKTQYPDLQKLDDAPHSTSMEYKIPGYNGTIGVIAAFSRTFCGTCNRIRVTASGMLKTCLYDDGVLDIKALMRRGASDNDLRDALLEAFNNRPQNGFEAESRRKNFAPVSESMSTIGG